MDNDEIEYLGTSYKNVLKGITLEPTSSTYPTWSFSLGLGRNSVSIEIGRLSSSSSSPKETAPDCALYRCAVVSRKHARLILNNYQVTIQDLESHHGTVVTPRFGKPNVLSGSSVVVLSDGDVLTFGKTVSDAQHGSFVLPVSVRVRFQFASHNRFGLTSLSDSSSDSEQCNSRGSSMDISAHSSPRHSPEPASSSSSSVVFRPFLPTNPHSMPSVKNHFADDILDDLDEDPVHFSFPPNQLGLGTESGFSHMSVFGRGDHASSSHPQDISPANIDSESSSIHSTQDRTQHSQRSAQAEVFMQDLLLSGVISSNPILDSQVSDELKNHDATVPFSHQLPPAIIDLASPGSPCTEPPEHVITSQTPLDMDPKTPIRSAESELRGREQSPLASLSVREQSVESSSQGSLETPLQNPPEGRGIRAFFKALGVVRNTDNSSTSSLDVQQQSAAQISGPDKDAMMAELRQFIEELVASRVDRTFEDVRENISTSVRDMEQTKQDVVNEMNRELDEFKGPLSSPAIRDILKTELLAHFDIEQLVRDMIADDEVVDIGEIVQAEVRDTLELAKVNVNEDLRSSVGEGMKMEVDTAKDEINKTIQDMKLDLQGQLDSVDPRISRIVQDAMAQDSDTRENDTRDRLEKMVREIEESKLLVEQLRQELEVQKAAWEHQVVTEKRKFEEDGESRAVKRARPSAPSKCISAVKTVVRNTVVSSLVATAGGLGVWIGLAYF
ncbi:hypothetical protein DL96DRAFT_1708418 [Flagelloscypha sp. PMI_526]|nr:hypothetical protein DL96DRAFT_1708418 [Flagelloscypha sp. PMI_526]